MSGRSSVASVHGLFDTGKTLVVTLGSAGPGGALSRTGGARAVLGNTGVSKLIATGADTVGCYDAAKRCSYADRTCC